MVFYVRNGISGNFGDISIGFGFVKKTNAFIFPCGSDVGLVVEYVFNRGGPTSIYFTDESKC
jgi:hypothetical protein